MREIKFRAWDKIQLVTFTTENPWDIPFWKEIKRNPNRYKLMQFTGLKDKNGKEIYEGDILAENPRKYNVPNHGLYDSAFVVQWSSIDGGDDADPPSHGYHFDESKLEVIGNIYENPDLLTSPDNQ